MELMPLLRRRDAAGPVMRQFRQSLGLSQQQMAEPRAVPNVAPVVRNDHRYHTGAEAAGMLRFCSTGLK
jgi:hypothetical protein